MVIIHVLLISHFYNRFWWPQDSGTFAHIADRMAEGEVFEKDIVDFHPGYLNFINAWAFELFGKDFVSLRFPLMAITLIQSGLLFLVFVRFQSSFGLIASLLPTSLGVFQFLDPNHHWYCLFLTIVTVCFLTVVPPKVQGRRFVIGIFLMLTYLFRQLSGILLAMGVVVYLLLEDQSQEDDDQFSWARLLIIVMFGALAFYLNKTTNPIGFILFGIWPLLILLWAWLNVRIPNLKFFAILKGLIGGAVLAILPILVYHMIHGSLWAWIEQSGVRAVLVVSKQEFLSTESYGYLIASGLLNLFQWKSLADVLNGFYWVLIPLMSVFNFFLLFRFVLFSPERKEKVYAIPLIAIFYSIVSLHNQVNSYLFFTISCAMLGILWIFCERNSQAKYLIGFVFSVLCGVGLYFHAGQPLFRDFIKGERIPFAFAGYALSRNHLWIDPADLAVYRPLIRLIEEETLSTDQIFAVPNNAELYFLSARKNPFRFFSTEQGIQSEEDFRAVMEQLKTAPVKLIIERTNDKRHTVWSKAIMAYVKGHYQFEQKIGRFEIYRIPENSVQ